MSSAEQLLNDLVDQQLKLFETRLRQEGLAEENVQGRLRGARQFVEFVFGRYRGKWQRTSRP